MLKTAKMFLKLLLKYWGLSGAKAYKSGRSRQELSNKHFLAKFGLDTGVSFSEKDRTYVLVCLNASIQPWKIVYSSRFVRVIQPRKSFSKFVQFSSGNPAQRFNFHIGTTPESRAWAAADAPAAPSHLGDAGSAPAFSVAAAAWPSLQGAAAVRLLFGRKQKSFVKLHVLHLSAVETGFR